MERFVRITLLIVLSLFNSSLQDDVSGNVNSYAKVVNRDSNTTNENCTQPSSQAVDLVYSGGCYQCSPPCSAYACCPGAYPQCCYIGGVGCRCCSR